MWTITPIEGAPLGARVDGVDLRTDLSDALMTDLSDALYRHRMIVIKNQDLDEGQYYRFGEQWGRLIRHVLDYLRMPGYPEMMAIGNTQEKDKDENVRNGAAHWHTDGSYRPHPTTMTMLYAKKAPKVGGETLFCDMVGAYDALDDADKTRAENSIAHHYYGAAKVTAGDRPVSPIKTDEQAKRYDPVKRALVMPHPVTGQKALYGVGQSPFAIDGMEKDDADDLITRYKIHATDDRFVYRHKYEVGDIAIFDCLTTMHKAAETNYSSPDDLDTARLLWRLSTEGLPKVVLARGVADV